MSENLQSAANYSKNQYRKPLNQIADYSYSYEAALK